LPNVSERRLAWPARITDVLQRALTVRDCRNAGAITAHGAAIARGRLFNELADLVNHPVRTPALQRFAAHLAVELPAVFGFLFYPTVDAVNWRAEQALRPAVVNLIARCPAAIARRAGPPPNRSWPV
jgi:transposase